MKNLVLTAAIALLAVSCQKNDGNDGQLMPIDPVVDFNYQTVKTVMASTTDNQAVDIFNSADEVLATNVSGRSIPVFLAMGDTYTTRSAVSQVGHPEPSSVYFPSKDGFATMMFEDCFPTKADYDMNDIVFDVRVSFLLAEGQSGQLGEIKTIKFDVVPRAAGSQMPSIALAAMLNGMPSLISSVETSAQAPDAEKKIAFTTSNGVETGTGNLTVIPITEDFRNQFTSREDGISNTMEKLGYNKGMPFTVTINLDKGQYFEDVVLFGSDPSKYNVDLFAIVGERSKEIHLKGMRPSPKFDSGLFYKTGRQDFSDKDNYIWGLVVPKSIPYPTEGTNIESAYFLFGDWVKGIDISAPWYTLPDEKGNCYSKES